MNTKLLIIVGSLALALLVGCTSKPNNIIIAVDYITPSKLSYAGVQASINVQDLRTQQHIVQIRKDGQAAKLLPAANSITEQIATKFKAGIAKQGLVISNNSQKTITLIVKKALIDVEQSLVKHKTKSNILIQVQALAPTATGKQQFSKNFTASSTSEMPLSPDIAVLERDFNQSLATVINNILASPELHTFLQ